MKRPSSLMYERKARIMVVFSLIFPALFIIGVPILFFAVEKEWLSFSVGLMGILSYHTILALVAHVFAEIQRIDGRGEGGKKYWIVYWLFPCLFSITICTILLVITTTISFVRPYVGW